MNTEKYNVIPVMKNGKKVVSPKSKGRKGKNIIYKWQIKINKTKLNDSYQTRFTGTEAEAREKALSLANKMTQYVHVKNVLFSTLYQDWELDPLIHKNKQNKIDKVSYKNTYIAVSDKTIIKAKRIGVILNEFFGDIYIGDIDQKDLDNFVNFAVTKWTAVYVRRILHSLKKVIRMASDKGMRSMELDFPSDKELTRRSKKKKDISEQIFNFDWTLKFLEELQKLDPDYLVKNFKELQNHYIKTNNDNKHFRISRLMPYYAYEAWKLEKWNIFKMAQTYFHFYFSWGYRPQEGSALSWKHINLDQGILRIEDTISMQTQTHNSFISPITKNHYKRDIPLDNNDVERLFDYYDWHEKYVDLANENVFYSQGKVSLSEWKNYLKNTDQATQKEYLDLFNKFNPISNGHGIHPLTVIPRPVKKNKKYSEHFLNQKNLKRDDRLLFFNWDMTFIDPYWMRIIKDLIFMKINFPVNSEGRYPYLYSGRRSFITNHATSTRNGTGLSVPLLNAVVGHARLETTMGYVNPDKQTIMDAQKEMIKKLRNNN